MRFFIRGNEVALRFDPVEVARREPRLARLRQRLIERAAGDERRVDDYLTERLGRAVARFADGYLIEHSGRIDRIVELRGQLSEIYDRVIAGETPGPEAARTADRLFGELTTEMRELRNPHAALAERPQLDLTGVAPLGEPRIAPTREATAGLGRRLDDVARLPAERQAALHRAANLDSALVRRIIGSQTESRLVSGLRDLDAVLQRTGMDATNRRSVLADLRELNRLNWNERVVDPASPAGRARVSQLLDAIEDPTAHGPDPFTLPPGADPVSVPALSSMEGAVEGRIRDLGRREAAARGRGSAAYAAELAREAGRLRAWVAAQGGASAAARALRAAIEADPDLQARLLRDGGVSFLQRLWLDYNAQPRESTFGRYVQNRTGEFRGQLGETAVGFSRGARYTFLKAPDDMVTQRGTDLVAVDRNNNNECLIIDNKAFSSTVVESVSALVRNIVRNLRDDVEAFRRDSAGRTDLPPELTDAVGRLERATNEIENDPLVRTARDPATGEFDPNRVRARNVQQRIDAILRKHNIRRVVTGEGGAVDSVSADLRAIGIDISR